MIVSINVSEAGKLSGIDAITAALSDPTGLHEAIAFAVGERVRDHIRKLDSRSPNTGWWGRVAESVRETGTAEAAEIVIPYRGFALRLLGGTVTSKDGKKRLAIPTSDVPIRDKTRLAPREAGVLAFIPNRHGDIHTTGYLVEGEMKAITRGPRKGQQRAVPKEGGKLMYVLRKLTVHSPDPTVLPGEGEIIASAKEAAADYIASFEGGAE